MRWREAHRLAMLTAAHAARDFAPRRTATEIVDPFKAAQEAGLLLAFRPMKKTSGAYVRDRYASGLLVNSQHPPARQRYTAAHELAHHLLNHASTTDADADFERGPAGVVRLRDDEMVAEAFAAWFLMPRQLVQAALGRLGLLAPNTAADVYQLALRLGTSYQATATHLPNVRKADAGKSNEWLQVVQRRGLLNLKLGLAGAPLLNNRNDVWLLGKGDEGQVCHVRPEDRLLIRLDEVPSSGYAWHLELPDGWTVLDDQSATTGADFNELAGQQAARQFSLDVPRSETPGTDQTLRVSAIERRPWDPTDVARVWSTQLTLTYPRLGFDERQLELQAAA